MPDLVLWMGIARAGPIVRVEQPLGAWRKHPGGAMSTTGAARAAEHLRLFEHGMALYPEVANEPELRAEALRNACVIAAWFGRYTEFAPGKPVTMVDQDWPLISAWAGGQDPNTSRFDFKHAESLSAALRLLGELTLELARVRQTDHAAAPSSGGYERAVQRLRGVGGLTGADGQTSRLDEHGFGSALIEAAIDCAADITPQRRRFLIPDRLQSELVADELQALVELTLAGPARGRGIVEAVEGEISRREQDLGRSRSPVP
ncbi:MAG: hypothetical protein JOZ73_11040 [Solirubrobacterales bacterium]|nr:hypothetical protein [Solirubrobacterales bacterium]